MRPFSSNSSGMWYVPQRERRPQGDSNIKMGDEYCVCSDCKPSVTSAAVFAGCDTATSLDCPKSPPKVVGETSLGNASELASESPWPWPWPSKLPLVKTSVDRCAACSPSPIKGCSIVPNELVASPTSDSASTGPSTMGPDSERATGSRGGACSWCGWSPMSMSQLVFNESGSCRANP